MDALESCVSSLGGALNSLGSGTRALGQGTADFGRLSTVLEAQPVFGILSNTEVQLARDDLAQAVAPQVQALLAQAEQEIARLERKDRTLISKANLQDVRLMQLQKSRDHGVHVEPYTSLSDDVLPTEAQLEEIRRLQKERDRLRYAKSRKDLQDRQKRLSMAVGRYPLN